VRRVAIVAISVVLTVVGFVRIDERTADAAGPSFQTVQFNICSMHCTKNLPIVGASNTNWGHDPISGLLNTFNQLGYPRVISLNEVCGFAALSFISSLPTNWYYVSFVVSKHNAGIDAANCGEFGNLIAVRTLDPTYSHNNTFHFAYAGFPPVGSTNEYRTGACSRSAVYIEVLAACSTHMDPNIPTTISSYRAGLNAWFANLARIGLGDFNQVPQSAHVGAWFASGYRDANEGYSVTYETHNNHLDYAMIGLDKLDGPDAGGVAFSSSSDHHLLYSPIHFK
jgi:hypothetical protein